MADQLEGRNRKRHQDREEQQRAVLEAAPRGNLDALEYPVIAVPTIFYIVWGIIEITQIPIAE